jgi:hypothetical protein
MDFGADVGAAQVGDGYFAARSGAPLGHSVAMLHEAMAVLADAVGSATLHSLAASTLADAERELRAIEHRIAAARLAMLPVIESEGMWALDGARSFPAWLPEVT